MDLVVGSPDLAPAQHMQAAGQEIAVLAINRAAEHLFRYAISPLPLESLPLVAREIAERALAALAAPPPPRQEIASDIAAIVLRTLAQSAEMDRIMKRLDPTGNPSMPPPRAFGVDR